MYPFFKFFNCSRRLFLSINDRFSFLIVYVIWGYHSISVLIAHNVFVYGKLRVCVRGFSEGKSDVKNVQRPFDLAKNSNFLYTVLAYVFF
ncbi:hypothetical protein C7H61_00995 [Mesoflavibacter zeaxanthinifaciens subsp. sabulilitoris]|uniref:Uncharacterized protein n=1 Tax=Mesoflavibacter zeaxanthinifaciens subsp. sabulilitoris TaxID=1520893 RepID=A0A2T1NNF9_9FLAO|nr:hypothetical protein C7H61_00995 [Mesoflavibacter zeaxanthinifaciens subsp. sabulilitoris]